MGQSTQLPSQVPSAPSQQKAFECEYIPTRIQVYDKSNELLIDEPVATGDVSYWLNHTRDGKPSIAGTPVLDDRCRTTSQHLLLYGHHIGSTGMFGPISQSFTQSVFDSISRVTLTLLDKDGHEKILTYLPLCAARVKEDNQEIQKVSFKSAEAYHAWLTKVYNAANVQGNEITSFNEATQTLTLVTCSEVQPNQPWRCVLTCILSK